MWDCFMVRAVEEQEAWLRRHAEGPCSAVSDGHSYHSAMTYIGRIALSYGEQGYIEAIDTRQFAGDERWPTQCACGHEFAESDDWQVMGRQLYEDEVGERRILDQPWRGGDEVETWDAGAMFDAPWLGDYAKGPDGLHLSVTLPPDGHIWHIDGPASGGGRWTRMGVPPIITVTPSILTPHYHGFLDNGMLSDSLSDRPLP